MENILNHLASRTNRFLAYLIDILPITVIVVLVFYNFFGFDEVWSAYQNRGENIEPRIAFLNQRKWIRIVSFLVWVIYSMFMDCSNGQGSFGKQAVGIKIVDDQGKKLTFEKAFVRNFGKALSYFMLFIGFVWIVFDKNKQGWHDKMAETYVVNKDFTLESKVKWPTELN